ncbi:hypothetical protein SteCoe_435 [Stentor coeruleus]|uniref:EF-hand domain-containing protein n=1 Tax=Stentor coeruleus TaxID=5963 RepID=A0A1R2D488_9CILI|nr:hypothetical protein SteCoe_435 [Stentor coeruleus]
MENSDLKLSSSQVIMLKKAISEFFSKHNTNKLKQIFYFFDRDGNGYLDSVELKTVMKQIANEKVTEDDVRQMMDEADTNKNGFIEYTEFCEIMLRLRRNQD